MDTAPQSVGVVVDDITRLHRSLPPRPEIDEVEAAVALLRAVDKEEKAQIDAAAKKGKASGEIPEEIFTVREQLWKNLVYFRCREQKREAMKLLDLENTHALFDELVQRADKCVCRGSGSSLERAIRRSNEFGSSDGSHLEEEKSVIRPLASSSDVGEKLSLIKFASLIEVAAKKGFRDLDVENKLLDQVDWLPASIGKLSGLITLNLSANQIVSLPTSIGSLPLLTKLDLHANRIAELPASIGDLPTLLHLNLRGNQLTSIPPTFSRLSQLVDLDLSANRLLSLPDALGRLTSLKKLNLDANDLEELPHTIGNCASLVELRADYNRLKGLPEAVGRLASLEILSVRYNSIKGLPTTVSSLSKLRELDVSFNALESVAEGLCLVTTLAKLNVGSNFADLKSLPRSLGNLEMLEELDVSNNQIRALPDSFGLLSHLRLLRLEENPLEVPPKIISQMEAQAVVEYMAEFVAKKAIGSPLKFCFFSRTGRRKHDDLGYGGKF